MFIEGVVKLLLLLDGVVIVISDDMRCIKVICDDEICCVCGIDCVDYCDWNFFCLDVVLFVCCVFVD